MPGRLPRPLLALLIPLLALAACTAQDAAPAARATPPPATPSGVRIGTLVVHRTVAGAVVTIFRTLYQQRFPIRRMAPVGAYGGSDDASMADDNTSGFNCRNAVNGGPAKWSAHASGKAIDVNPVENPYLLNGDVLPPAGRAYADRATNRAGMAVPDGALVKAFAAAGWSWGGRWSDPDYQHFSSGGG